MSTEPSVDVVLHILSEERLAALREAYAQAEVGFFNEALNGYRRRLGKSVDFVQPLLTHFYSAEQSERHKERERVLIALLAATHAGYELAIHYYWGLMEGLEPSEITDILLLVYAYTGVDEYTSAIALFEKVLRALDQQPTNDLKSCYEAVVKVSTAVSLSDVEAMINAAVARELEKRGISS